MAAFRSSDMGPVLRPKLRRRLRAPTPAPPSSPLPGPADSASPLVATGVARGAAAAPGPAEGDSSLLPPPSRAPRSTSCSVSSAPGRKSGRCRHWGTGACAALPAGTSALPLPDGAPAPGCPPVSAAARRARLCTRAPPSLPVVEAAAPDARRAAASSSLAWPSPLSAAVPVCQGSRRSWRVCRSEAGATWVVGAGGPRLAPAPGPLRSSGRAAVGACVGRTLDDGEAACTQEVVEGVGSNEVVCVLQPRLVQGRKVRQLWRPEAPSQHSHYGRAHRCQRASSESRRAVVSNSWVAHWPGQGKRHCGASAADGVTPVTEAGSHPDQQSIVSA